MSAPISFTVRPPPSSSSSSAGFSAVPARPSPLSNGSRSQSRTGPPSRRLFEAEGDSDDDDGDSSRYWGGANGHGHGSSSSASVGGNNSRSERKSGQSAPSGPFVIPALPNKDWRESSRRVPSFRPEGREHRMKEQEAEGHRDRIGDGAQASGITHYKREQGVKAEDQGQGLGEGDVKVEMKRENGAAAIYTSNRSNGPRPSTEEDVKPSLEALSLDQQALQELLHGAPETETETPEQRAQRDLIISLRPNEDRVLSESEALQRDIVHLPDSSTMEDFEAVPISAFGIAALRGMGWDPNAADNVKPREVARRPQLLGLGATPMEVKIPERGSGGMGTSMSRREREREREKAQRKREREERGKKFTVANLMLKKSRERSGEADGDSAESRGGSGATTPMMRGSRAGSSDTAREYDSDASRRRRREGDDDDGRGGSKRRDDRDGREGRYETEEERARRKAREARDVDRDGDRERDRYRDRNGDRDRYRDRDRERERERERDRDTDRIRDDDKDREKERDRDRYRDDWRDRERGYDSDKRR